MFDWLFGKTNYYRFQDSYALTQETTFQGMLDALSARLAKGEVVFLFAHFPKMFAEIQERLSQSKLEYEIVSEPIDFGTVSQLAKQSDRIYLSLAQMLRRNENSLQEAETQSLAVVSAQRHPMPKYDQLIEDWCRQLPFPVELGYFLSLDDPVISHVISEQAKKLMAQLGLGDNELVTSDMVSRRLKKVLNRKAATVIEEIDADSAAEWIEANYS